METNALARLLLETHCKGQLLRDLEAELKHIRLLTETDSLRITKEIFGQVVEVYLTDGSIFNGIFFALEPSTFLHFILFLVSALTPPKSHIVENFQFLDNFNYQLCRL